MLLGVVEEESVNIRVRDEDKKFIAKIYSYCFVGIMLYFGLLCWIVRHKLHFLCNDKSRLQDAAKNKYLSQANCFRSCCFGRFAGQNRKYSIYKESSSGSFKFYHIRKILAPESDISNLKKLAVILKYNIRKIAGSPAKWYGLENSNMMIEYVPLFIQAKHYDPFKRKTQ